MTNYNDGNWHGWNGGECPVDERCEVVIMWEEVDGSFCGDKCYASMVAWDFIDAFRVVKGRREPREFWVCLQDWTVWGSKSEATYHDNMAGKVVHVREVIE